MDICLHMSGMGTCKGIYYLDPNKCLPGLCICPCRGLGPRWDQDWCSCWDFLTVTSLFIDLGLETDATEDDFGVWEVKTMVAVILHLLEGPSGKVPLPPVTCSQDWVNVYLLTFSKSPSPLVTFFETTGRCSFVTSSPSTVLFLQSLVGRPPPPDPADPHAISSQVNCFRRQRW